MKICLFGTYQKSYPRNVTLIRGLKRLGAELIDCHVPLWDEYHDRSQLMGNWKELLKTSVKQLKAWFSLTHAYLSSPEHDIVLVLYPGHLDVGLAVLLARVRGKKVIFDAFLSLFDLYISDRKYSSEKSFMGRFLFWIDKISGKFADLILIDTLDQAEFYAKKFGLESKKLISIPVGCDESVFYPREKSDKPGNILKVVYFGKYIPFHGVDIIVRAAFVLKERKIGVEWLLIGSGQEFAKVARLVKELSMEDTVQLMTDWVDPGELSDVISDADICLGVFGTGEKADRVIPCKIFNALAMAKPVVTGESAAVKRFAKGGKGIMFCKRGDADSLADALLLLKETPQLRDQMGQEGYHLYKKHISESVITAELEKILNAFRLSPS